MTENQKETKGIILWGVGGLYGVRPYPADDLYASGGVSTTPCADGDRRNAADTQCAPSKEKAAAKSGADCMTARRTDPTRTAKSGAGESGSADTDSSGGAASHDTETRPIILCRARGAFRHEGISPLPGDIVKVICDDDTSDAEKHGVIDDIYPRRTALVRPALANLTHLFAVIPAARPAPVLLGADKLICAADNAGIEPVIVITKSELDPDSARRIEDIYKRSGFTVFALCGDGSRDGELTDYMAAEAKSGLMCAAFAGVSGAGKSTLMSRIFPSLSLKTGELSRKIQRGRHTTRHAELYPIDIGGAVCFIADTPGFSVMDFSQAGCTEPSQLAYAFREFAPLMGRCRYTKCTHTSEEGCAVLAKVESGTIPESRHESYCAMYEELRRNPPWKKPRQK